MLGDRDGGRLGRERGFASQHPWWFLRNITILTFAKYLKGNLRNSSTTNLTCTYSIPTEAVAAHTLYLTNSMMAIIHNRVTATEAAIIAHVQVGSPSAPAPGRGNAASRGRGKAPSSALPGETEYRNYCHLFYRIQNFHVQSTCVQKGWSTCKPHSLYRNHLRLHMNIFAKLTHSLCSGQVSTETSAACNCATAWLCDCRGARLMSVRAGMQHRHSWTISTMRRWYNIAFH